MEIFAHCLLGGGREGIAYMTSVLGGGSINTDKMINQLVVDIVGGGSNKSNALMNVPRCPSFCKEPCDIF